MHAARPLGPVAVLQAARVAPAPAVFAPAFEPPGSENGLALFRTLRQTEREKRIAGAYRRVM